MHSGVIVDDETETTRALVSKGFQTFSDGKVPTFIDSGASNTMFVSRADFSTYNLTPPRSSDSAKAVDGNFDIIGEGTVVKSYLVDGKEKKLTYTRAIHTPTLNANLVSVSAFDNAGLTVTFGGRRGVVRKGDGTAVLSARLVKGMYVVDELTDDLPRDHGVPIAMASLSKSVSLEQWHRRFAHCSLLKIAEMSKGNLVDGLTVSGHDLCGKCEDCIIGRQARRPFDRETERSLDVLELVSFDLWGPSRIQSVGGKLYFMPIVDAGSSYKHGAYLSDKSDSSTIAAFNTFRVEAESLSGRKVRRIRTDHAYDTSAWKDYCRTHGIIHEFTAPYSSAQNGLAERAIRTTMDDVRTLLCDSGLGHSYWAEAASYSVDTRNFIPSRRHPARIPLEVFTLRAANYLLMVEMDYQMCQNRTKIDIG
jgi:histone deacetylase 1/2